MLSRVSMDGDNPPWRQNISDSTFKREGNTCQYLPWSASAPIFSFKTSTNVENKVILTNAVSGK